MEDSDFPKPHHSVLPLLASLGLPQEKCALGNITILEPTEWSKGSQASSSVWREDSAPGKSGLHARGEGERVLALVSFYFILFIYLFLALLGLRCCASSSLAAMLGLLVAVASLVVFSCMAWRAILSPLSKLKRRLDSL